MQYALNNMISLAVAEHDGQYDKGGSPYILHCIAVMEMLNTEDEELKCIAVGHDLIEDTCTSALGLYEIGFSSRIVRGIEALTKSPSQSYEDYKKQVMTNKDAMLVKLCDLRHNSDIRRLKGLTDKDTARIAKYNLFYSQIKEKLSA